jgi:hypothetical protein
MNYDRMCTFIVIWFKCDELWFYLINFSFIEFCYFENLLVETGMLMSACLVRQFCTVAMGGALHVSTVGVTIEM